MLESPVGVIEIKINEDDVVKSTRSKILFEFDYLCRAEANEERHRKFLKKINEKVDFLLFLSKKANHGIKLKFFCNSCYI